MKKKWPPTRYTWHNLGLLTNELQSAKKGPYHASKSKSEGRRKGRAGRSDEEKRDIEVLWKGESHTNFRFHILGGKPGGIREKKAQSQGGLEGVVQMVLDRAGWTPQRRVQKTRGGNRGKEKDE